VFCSFHSDLSIQFYMRLEEKNRALEEERLQYEARKKVLHPFSLSCLLQLHIHVFVLFFASLILETSNMDVHLLISHLYFFFFFPFFFILETSNCLSQGSVLRSCTWLLLTILGYILHVELIK
jgi:hypothetical protein